MSVVSLKIGVWRLKDSVGRLKTNVGSVGSQLQVFQGFPRSQSVKAAITNQKKEKNKQKNLFIPAKMRECIDTKKARDTLADVP